MPLPSMEEELEVEPHQQAVGRQGATRLAAEETREAQEEAEEKDAAKVATTAEKLGTGQEIAARQQQGLSSQTTRRTPGQRKSTLDRRSKTATSQATLTQWG